MSFCDIKMNESTPPKAGFFITNMKIIKLTNLSKARYKTLMRRSSESYQTLIPEVKRIMENIQKNGDSAIVKKYQTRFGEKQYTSIQVTQLEIINAYQNVDKKFIQSLKQMIKNITLVHTAQLPKKKDIIVSPEKGIKVWREWRAIEKVGLYIPGGKAVYPSSVLMTAIPAMIAGCKEIVLCSPPNDNGQIPAPTLVAVDLLGITNIYKVGGAEAIAAMTYGTKTIPAVYKIFGAGNTIVTAAKMIALQTIAIDMPAGPSEVFIIADETANPAFIAADLLADGEHGEDSACVLLTTSQTIAENTVKEIEKQLLNLSTANRCKKSLEQYGLIAIVASFDEAITFVNDYAPEHLELMVKNPTRMIEKIQNAGSVFLGNWTTKSSGDYATGANHVLPTGGAAKMYPPLGVDSFGKWMQVQSCTKKGLKSIKNTIETVAEIEQLPAHKNATTIRFQTNI